MLHLPMPLLRGNFRLGLIQRVGPQGIVPRPETVMCKPDQCVLHKGPLPAALARAMVPRTQHDPEPKELHGAEAPSLEQHKLPQPPCAPLEAKPVPP